MVFCVEYGTTRNPCRCRVVGPILGLLAFALVALVEWLVGALGYPFRASKKIYTAKVAMNAIPRQRNSPCEFQTKTICIWWDMEDCPLEPIKSFDVHRIKDNMTSVLRRLGYSGEIIIFAYGFIEKVPMWIRSSFLQQNINFVNIGSGSKNTTIKNINTEMLIWKVKNKDPAIYLLIAGNDHYADPLCEVKLRNNQILLAYPFWQAPQYYSTLVCAADI